MEGRSTYERGPESRVAAFGFSEAQGRREAMEDAHAVAVITTPDGEKIDFFGLYDGHGSRVGADIAAQRMHAYIEDALQKGASVEDALKQAFARIDKDIEEKERYERFGTTAGVALLRNKEVISANVGDTRVLLIDQTNKVERLSEEHRLVQGSAEEKRIQDLGGEIAPGEYRRIISPESGWPGLMIARALGDGDYGDLVSAEPYISHAAINETHRRVVLACDGVFDVIGDSEVANLIKNEPDATKASDIFTKTALERGSLDNVSAIVIDLTP